MSSANESAYPVQTQSFPARDGDYTVHESIGGLTKREAFAMAVMQGLMANPGGPVQSNGMSGWSIVNCTPDNIAGLAIEMADALLLGLETDA